MCADCPLIGEIPVSSLQNVTQLEHLRLDMTNCHELPSIDPFTLSALTSLRTVKLKFTSCKKLSNITPLGLGTQLKMKQLEMHFQNCGEIRDLSALGSLETLRQLKQLVLNFSNCKYLHGNCLYLLYHSDHSLVSRLGLGICPSTSQSHDHTLTHTPYHLYLLL